MGQIPSSHRSVTILAIARIRLDEVLFNDDFRRLDRRFVQLSRSDIEREGRDLEESRSEHMI